MTLTQKRKRAAIIAVSCYFQMENCATDSSNDIWGKMGINRIVSGREFSQRKGRTPGTRPF